MDEALTPTHAAPCQSPGPMRCARKRWRGRQARVWSAAPAGSRLSPELTTPFSEGLPFSD